MRKKVAILVVLIAVVSLTTPVAAEGSWSSYLSGVRIDFESRTWSDYDTDAVSTSVRFDNCRDAIQGNTNVVADVGVYRERTFLPDIELGRQNLSCYYSDTGFYGRAPAGNYHFTIKNISNCSCSWQHLDSSYVLVIY